ncbi:MAG: hypothetical protein Q7T97_02500 [Burkholderiaceae bacterium]|nr:hypothetical protein [Burkholderiaceae bacterium]
MRLDPFPRFPADSSQLIRKLTDLFRDTAKQVNDLTEGKVSAVTNAATSVPTTGTWKQGDFVKHSAPTVAGIAPNTYIVHGWECTVGGTPGTWVAMNVPTAVFGGGGGGGSVLSAEVIVTPAATGRIEHSETVTFTGCLPANKLFVSVAPHADSDENSADMLGINAMSATAGTDQATVLLSFSEPTSGPIRLNLMAV